METLSIKVDKATRDRVESLRVTGGRIVSASAVGRRLIEQALSGGGVPIALPVLAYDLSDLEEMREGMGRETRPSLACSRALLRFYDEVMAMAGQVSK
jgi:hypothetical protein